MAGRNDRDYAFVVGIDEYPRSSLDGLSGARRDARLFVKWLKRETGGDVPPENIMEFIAEEEAVDPERGDTADTAETEPRPTHTELVDAIKRFVERKFRADQRIGRRLYIFLAGHGLSPAISEASLLAADFTELSTQHLPGRKYADSFRTAAWFEEIVLCVDCCRDAEDELASADFPVRIRANPASSRVRCFYAFATGFTRKSREREFDGEVRGIFSHALLEGLDGGAADGEGRVTGQSLEKYLKRTLEKERQEPVLPTVDDELVLAEGLEPARVRVIITLSDPDRPFRIRYGDGLREVDVEVVDLGGNERAVKLIPGKNYAFDVRDDEGRTIAEAGHTLKYEEELRVEL